MPGARAPPGLKRDPVASRKTVGGHSPYLTPSAKGRPHMSNLEVILVLLLGVVVTNGIAQALRGRIALPIIQIAFGALIGMTTEFGVKLEPELFFVLFLPPLLFLDGWRVPTEDLADNAVTILSLAFGLVFFTVLGIGFLLHVVVPPMPLPVCFALAAVLSPTDVVAAGAMMANVPVPQRMLRILQGEALFNDASGLVCLRLAIAAVMTGAFQAWDAVGTLIWTAAGGIAIGMASTWMISGAKSWVSSRIGEITSSQIIISLLIPYGAYLIADRLGCSAVLAAVAAGMVMSRMEIRGLVLPITRVQRSTVWETLQFALNGAIFLLLGEQFPAVLSHVGASMAEDGHRSIWWLGVYVGAVTLALAALRFVWVWVTVALWLGRHRSEIPGRRPNWRLTAAMSTAGVRGAVTLAGALSIPLALPDGSPFPARDLAILIAAGVIVASLILANLTLPRLLDGIRLPAARPDTRRAQAARLEAVKAAIAAVATAEKQHPGRQGDPLSAAASVADDYQRRQNRLSTEDVTTSEETRLGTQAALQEERRLRLLALHAERSAILRMARDRRISMDLARKLLRETDLMEASYEPLPDAP